MNKNQLNERTGGAIDRAAEVLPKGYAITIDLEQGGAIIRLMVPPLSDDDPGQIISEFSGDDFATKLENAIDYAVDHDAEHKD